MSANWTDDENHFLAGRIVWSGEKSHTSWGAIMPLMFYSAWILKKTEQSEECLHRQSLCENGLIYQRGLCFSLRNSQVGVSNQTSLHSHIWCILPFFPPLLLRSRRHLFSFGFLAHAILAKRQRPFTLGQQKKKYVSVEFCSVQPACVASFYKNCLKPSESTLLFAERNCDSQSDLK